MTEYNEIHCSCGINSGFKCFCRKPTCTDNARRRWIFGLLILLIFECLYNFTAYKAVRGSRKRTNYLNVEKDETKISTTSSEYKYLIKNSLEIVMDYKVAYNSSYYWFTSMKNQFKNLGDTEIIKYPKDIPNCDLNISSFGPIFINKSVPQLEWVEEQNPDVKLGGYYAPAHCRALHRVAVIVPYRNRWLNLLVFLRYLHPLLQKQQLEYRIFVIEQNGTEQFNKGTLYNIAFLETQRFGTWDCLIFHDVDLIPKDERILYTCPEFPTHMSPAVERLGYILPYASLFGGVTSLKPKHYEQVNGYSNFYWSWGAEDDDMSLRLQSAGLRMLRYNDTIAKYASLYHARSPSGAQRHFLLRHSKLRFRKEGLVTTKYCLNKVIKENLYTHIIADVNPVRLKLDPKTIIRQMVSLFGNSMEFTPRPLTRAEHFYRLNQALLRNQNNLQIIINKVN